MGNEIEMHVASLVGTAEEAAASDTSDEPGFIDAEGDIQKADAPGDVHDDQAEVNPDLVAQPDTGGLLRTAQAESSGRLEEIVDLRSQLRDQGTAVNQMREMMLADADERARAAETARFGQDVLEDPAMQRLDARFDKLEGRIESDRQEREHRIQEVNRITTEQRAEHENMQQLSNFAVSSEQKFVADHPDSSYHEAYNHLREVRGKVYSSRGLSKADIEQRLGMEEIQLITEAAQAGRDPATDVYNMAIEFGFSPAEAKEAKANIAPVPDLSRVKEGLELANPSDITRTPGRDTSGTLTREQFFNDLPYPERMAILSDQDKFEELTKTGKITL